MIILRILSVVPVAVVPVAVAEPFCLFPEMDINRFEVMCMRKQFRIKLIVRIFQTVFVRLYLTSMQRG